MFRSRIYHLGLSSVRRFCGHSVNKKNPAVVIGRSYFIQIRKLASSASAAPKISSSDAEALNYSARVDLAAAYRGFMKYDLHEGICNHLSLSAPSRDGSTKVMLLIPYGLHWQEVTASKLVGVDVKTGEVIEGEGKPETSASEIHRAVHNARPDISTCLHVHPPYSTALGMLKDPRLLMLHQNSCKYYNDIAYDVQYDGFATTGEEGPRMAGVLGDKKVMVMANHGILVVGKKVAHAFDDIYYFERSAKFQILAMSTGKELRHIPENVVVELKEEWDATFEQYAEDHFESIKRLLDMEKPDFRS